MIPCSNQMTFWGLFLHEFSSVQLLSCVTLCDPMDCRMPRFPVHHQIPKLTQTLVHQVGDAIQPSHPLSSLQSFPQSGSFPVSRLFASGGPKYWSFSISPSNEYLGLISFTIDWFDLHKNPIRGPDPITFLLFLLKDVWVFLTALILQICQFLVSFQ